MKRHKDNATPESRPSETTRLEAFSDGVFSIAITLLVLELIQFLHPQNSEPLLQSFKHHWQPFLAFIIGFVTILVCWINHHHAFDYINKVDGKFMWVNGFLLFMVTVTPFSTAIFAEFLKTEGKMAVAIFGFNFFLIAIAAYSICAYAYKKFLVDEASRDFFYCLKSAYAYSIAYTLVSFFICFLSIPVSILLYMLLFAVFAFPKEVATVLLKRKNRIKNKIKAAVPLANS
ncbi:MAG TPA: TMEM175 family protein [Chitinophagaceae bacterium]|nr:TMEM175 family protein [Chitinophagaceae bacterium]